MNSLVAAANFAHPYTRDFIETLRSNGITLFSYEVSAINELVKGLTAFNLWDKFISLYPYVGRNSVSHSFNLIDPRKWRLTFSRTITHNANGITSNGSDGYGNTGIQINNLSQFNFSMGSYRRTIGTNGASLYPDIGSSYTPTGNTDRFFIGSNSTDTTNQNGVAGFGGQGAGSTTQGSLTGTGMKCFTCTDNGGSGFRSINNGAVTFTGSGNQTWQANGHIWICRCSTFFGTQNISLSYTSVGLTNTESLLLSNIVQNYQSLLNRAV